MESLIELVRREAGPWSLVAVFVAAALEYLLPPLPADTVLLASALLVVSQAYSFTTVLGVAVLGGFAGAAIHYGIGRLALTAEGKLRGGRYVERITGHGSLERFFETFRRHGMWVIAINRALPGVRGVTFFAAGAAHPPFWATMAFGLVSNVLWSALILSVGLAVGGNWAKIERAFRVYQIVVYLVLGLGILGVLIHRLRRRRSAE